MKGTRGDLEKRGLEAVPGRACGFVVVMCQISCWRMLFKVALQQAESYQSAPHHSRGFGLAG